MIRLSRNPESIRNAASPEMRPLAPMWIASRPKTQSNRPPSSVMKTTTSHDSARDPARRMSKTNNGTVLLRMWPRLACRNGIAGIPTRPIVVRGRTPKWSSAGNIQLARNTAQMAPMKRTTPEISWRIVWGSCGTDSSLF